MKLPLLCLLTLPLLAELPPLLDRKVFFGDPEITGAQLSPDGKYLAFIKPLDGTRNVWVKRTSEPFAAAKPVTALTKRPVGGYFWSRDSRFVLFINDDGGDENFNVYAVDPAAAAAAGQKAPPARNITSAQKIQAQIYQVSRVNPDLMFVGLNDRDKAWHDLYRVKISTGERTLLRQNTGKIAGWLFDLEDQLRLAVKVAANGDTEIHRVEGDRFVPIYACSVLESCDPIRFHKDGKRLYLTTNKGSDLSRLILLDPATGKEELVEGDPLNRVDFGNAIFSEATEELVGTVYADEKARRYWKDKAVEADMKFLEGRFPDRQVNRVSVTRDDQLWLIAINADVEPGAVHLFDRKSRKLTPQYRVREEIPREHLAAMKPVRYKSSDGLEIPAYLTLPKGIPAKNLPVVLVPHGGPWARDNWGYNGIHQFLANRGYAALSMNFRGSTGYGKRFLNLGNNEWGQKMQDDITWGVKHLVAEGIADPKRVGIMGGSYGGYATLAGVAFTPDLYAAGVAIVAPSNLVTLLESIPPYWEAGRMMFNTRMGDMRTPEGRAQLKRQSPLYAADKIKTPLMVVQGANDPRVNKAESDQIVIALRDRKYPVKYLVADDEGHGFAKPVNNLALFTATERFLEQHLGGRAQKEASSDVATRLDQMTVDPAKVTLAKKVEATAENSARPVRMPRPGLLQYGATLEMGGQKMNLTMSSELKAGAAGFTIVDKLVTPMGEAEDESVVDPKTLALRSRSVNQGPVAVKVTATDAKITGAMSMNGQERPVDAETGGPLFGDSGTSFLLGTLPLAEGYATTFRNFDLQRMKVKVMQLEVKGSEPITVPAGKFDAFKVEVKPADGSAGLTTYWVDQASGRVVRMEGSMGNGAKLAAELKSR